MHLDKYFAVAARGDLGVLGQFHADGGRHGRARIGELDHDRAGHGQDSALTFGVLGVGRSGHKGSEE